MILLPLCVARDVIRMDVQNVLTQVIPVVASGCEFRRDELVEDVLESDGGTRYALGLVKSLLEPLNRGDVFRAHVVHGDDRVAPLARAIRYGIRILAIDRGPL